MKRLVRRLGAAALVVGAIISPASATAQVSEFAREAGTHFRRGVEFYGEANYSGALVEFKRAYALVPSSASLYDVGEVQFQLQDYAAALQTFTKFLAEFGPNESRRAAVEANVQLLSTRVGRLRVATVPNGADVTVDDEPVGKTPLAEPRMVSVGHRKLVASLAGRAPVTRYVDVAAGDDVTVTLPLSSPIEPEPTPLSSKEREVVSAPPPRASVLPTLRSAGWITTGALASGAAVMGLLAIREAKALSEARSGLTTSSTLAHDASLTKTFAIAADSLAAGAIIAGVLSLSWTLSNARGTGMDRSTRLTVGPTSTSFETTF
jgi:hypothetical protein